MYVEPGKSIARYNYVIHNHEKLVAVLEGTNDNAHNQATWGHKTPKNECGTAACAMGWAAISGEFENIQSLLGEFNVSDYIRWQNGETIPIYEAARREFGNDTYEEVFMCVTADRCHTISKLKRRIEELKKEQKKLHPFRAVL